MKVHAQQAELGDAGDELPREGARLEVLGDDRQRAVAHEGAHRVADQALVIAEQVVNGEEIGRCQRAGSRRALGDGHALRVPG